MKALLFSTMFALGVVAASLGGQPAIASPATGWLHLTLTEHSPLSAPGEVLKRLDMADHPPENMESLAYGPSFDVFVPPSYNPNAPHGLLVWMGMTEFSSAWLDALSRHQLILVCANNVKGHPARYGAALDAVHYLKKLYSIDDDRVYVSGFSAGSQVATHMVRCFPEVFRGGLFLLGGSFYISRQAENGQREPTVEPVHPVWKGQLDQLKTSVKLVMMKGGNDPQWTPQEGRADYQALWLDRFTHITYIEVPGLGHTPPSAYWFEQGIIALDQSKPLTPPVISPTKEAQPLPSQVAQARRLLVTALYYLDIKPPKPPQNKIPKDIQEKMLKMTQDKARKYLQQVLDEYPTTPAAAKASALMRGIDQETTGRRVS